MSLFSTRTRRRLGSVTLAGVLAVTGAAFTAPAASARAPVTIAITSPASGTVLPQGTERFTVTYALSDPDGAVAVVELSDGIGSGNKRRPIRIQSPGAAFDIPVDRGFGIPGYTADYGYDLFVTARDDDYNVLATSELVRLDVVPSPLAPRVASLGFTDPSVVGGASTELVVRLDQPARADGTTVRLNASGTGSRFVTNVPATLVIAAGETSATFMVDTAAAPNRVTARIYATAVGQPVALAGPVSARLTIARF